MVKFELNFGTLYGIKEDGTPKRLSMFPPSYADRAIARARQRQALRAASESQEQDDGKSVRPNGVSTIAPGNCNHECSSHIPVSANDTDFQEAKQSKENSSGDQIENQAGDQQLEISTQATKSNIKGNRQDTEKIREKTSNVVTFDSENSSAEESSGEKTKSKAKNPKPKVQAPKDKKGIRENALHDMPENSECEKQGNSKAKGKLSKKSPIETPFEAGLWASPSSTCPWAYDSNRWTSQRRALEYAARGFQESIEAARKADQEIAEQWMKDTSQAVRQGAFKWLQERDAIRHGNSSRMYSTGWGGRGVQYLGGPIPKASQQQSQQSAISQPSSRPEVAFPPMPWIHTNNVGGTGYLQTFPILVYQDQNNRMFTQDGLELRAVSNGHQGRPTTDFIQQTGSKTGSMNKGPNPHVGQCKDAMRQNDGKSCPTCGNCNWQNSPANEQPPEQMGYDTIPQNDNYGWNDADKHMGNEWSGSQGSQHDNKDNNWSGNDDRDGGWNEGSGENNQDYNGDFQASGSGQNNPSFDQISHSNQANIDWNANNQAGTVWNDWDGQNVDPNGARWDKNSQYAGDSGSHRLSGASRKNNIMHSNGFPSGGQDRNVNPRPGGPGNSWDYNSWSNANGGNGTITQNWGGQNNQIASSRVVQDGAGWGDGNAGCLGTNHSSDPAPQCWHKNTSNGPLQRTPINGPFVRGQGYSKPLVQQEPW